MVVRVMMMMEMKEDAEDTEDAERKAGALRTVQLRTASMR
jgi:hypothetical protein